MKKIHTRLFLFTLICACASFVLGQTENRVSTTWQVQRYDIAATLPQADTDRYLGARATLSIKNISSNPATTLTLRISDKAEVSAVKVSGAANDFTKGEEKITGSRNLQRIVIRMPSVAPGAAVQVEVTYRLKVEENSGLGAISPIGSQFLPLSFWYPTPNSWFFSRGGDFAPYTINVTTAGGQTAYSSGAGTGSAFDNKLNGQPFFVAGNWETVESASKEGPSFQAYLPKGAGDAEKQRAQELLALAQEAGKFVEAQLGTGGASLYRLVGVRRGSGFSDGGTILIDDNVFRRQKIDAQTAMIIADAVAKSWLGNGISINGDGYGVVREGLSRYIATQFLESKYGKDIADLERLRQRTAYAAISKRDAPLNIVAPLDDYYYTEVANKGAMIWRLLARRLGEKALFDAIRANAADGNLSMAELRAAFSSNKDFLDYAIDQITDMNLMAGLPVAAAGGTTVNLRNTGATDATVTVQATTASGEKLTAQATVRATNFGAVTFQTPQKIVRVEVDSEKLYPQTEYLDDVAPREFDDSDVLLVVKRLFDKQEFANAETAARKVLANTPRFDDVRILLARALLAQSKNAEAEKEFRAALDEKLPSARTIAWANEGLGETASRAGQTAQAIKYADEAIRTDAEYGATLAARALRVRANASPGVDENIKAYFAQFDKVAASNRKTDLEAMAVSGEAVKFTSGISGQTESWQTQVLTADRLDTNIMIVETRLNIKMLTKEPESGTAVYRLARVGSGWKLLSVDMFEVR
jgi:tetratricopeptide (TPR) repeat protein